MTKRGNKKEWVLIICLAVLFCFFCFNNIRLSLQRKDLEKRTLFFQKEMERVLKEKEVFEGRILEKDELEYLEKIARDELNFKKQGETVVSFPLSSTSSETRLENQSFWKRILEKVK